MKENHYSQPNFSPPQVARGKQCQSTPPWQRRLLAFLLLVMALAVPRQAYAGAHFGKVYDGEKYKEYDGTYLGHYVQYIFWFFFTIGLVIFGLGIFLMLDSHYHWTK